MDVLVRRCLLSIKLKISYEGGRGEKGTRHILRDPLALLLNEKINSEGFDHCSLEVDAGAETVWRNTESLVYYALCMGVFNGKRVCEEYRRITQGRANLQRSVISDILKGILESLAEEDVWTSSFNERLRNTNVKINRGKGRRPSLEKLEQLDGLIIELADLYKLDRKEVSFFFLRHAGLLTGKNCYSIFERAFDNNAQKPEFVNQARSLWGPGAAADSQLVAGRFASVEA